MPNNLAAKETKKNASNSHAVFFASEGGLERLLAPHRPIIVNLVKLVDQVGYLNELLVYQVVIILFYHLEMCLQTHFEYHI